MVYWDWRGIIRTFKLFLMILLLIIIMIIRKLEMDLLEFVDTTVSFLLKDMDLIDEHLSAIKTSTSFHQRTTEKSMSSFIFDFRFMPFFSHNAVILPGGFDQFYEFLLDNSHVPQSDLTAMHFEINRLKSFARAPELNMSFIKLAANGFYYDLFRKTCRCAFCDFEKYNWGYHDNVSDEHRRARSSCPFINNTYLSGNVPMHNRNIHIVSQAVAQHGYASSCQQINHRRVCGRSLLGQNSESHNLRPELQPTTDGITCTPDSSNQERRLQGENDTVRCFCCDLGLAEWDDPWIEHARHSPTCRFLVHTNGDDFVQTTQRDWEQIYNPKHAQFEEKDLRLRSYDGWRSDIDQSPALLAEAGFFYTGEEDIVRCHYCDGGLRDWEPGDDPWEEHTRWFPFCTFVIKMKGREYIETIRQQARQQPTQDHAENVIITEVVGNVKNKEPVETDPMKLLERNMKLKEQLKCLRCKTNEACILFVNCGHRVTCEVCAEKMDFCLICNKKVKKRVKTFLS